MPIFEQFISSFFKFAAPPSSTSTAHSIGTRSGVDKNLVMRQNRTSSSTDKRPSSFSSTTSQMDVDNRVNRETRSTRTLSMSSTISGSSMGMHDEPMTKPHVQTSERKKEAAKGNLKARVRRSSSTPSSVSLSGSNKDPGSDTSNRKSGSSNRQPAKSKLPLSTHSIQSRRSAGPLSPVNIQTQPTTPMSRHKPSSRSKPPPTPRKPVVKDLKRKRSSSSISSLTNINLGPLTSKLYGFIAKSPKRPRLAEDHPTSTATSSRMEPIEEIITLPEETSGKKDIHSALRSGGVRLLGTSVDFDDIYDDRPDDLVLDPTSVYQLISGDHPLADAAKVKPEKQAVLDIKVETTLYFLWRACRKACDVHPYLYEYKREYMMSGDEMEEQVWRREKERDRRNYYAFLLLFIYLGQEILERLPRHGIVHIPVDPRLSNNVVDIVHHTLTLVKLCKEVGADSSRFVFDIPATHAGIHAGRILSLEHRIHVNFTFVCNLNQAATCLRAEPYGISLPIKAMKAREEADAHSTLTLVMSNPVGLSCRSLFETIRSIVKFVEMHGLGIKVSARDVDNRDDISSLNTIHSISPAPKLLTDLRWYATIRENWPPKLRQVYTRPTQEQIKRAEAKAREMITSNGPLGVAGDTASPKKGKEEWERALKEEITRDPRRLPKIQRTYLNGDWIVASGLPKHIEASIMGQADVSKYGLERQSFIPRYSYASGGTSTAQIQPCQWFSQERARQVAHRTPHFFMDLLSTNERRKVTILMETSLEEQCRQMGQVHGYVGRYLAAFFSPESIL